MKLYSGIVELKSGWLVRMPYPMTFVEMSRYRFDPVTLTVIALAATAASVTGSVMEGQAAEQQGKNENAMMKYNAAVENEKAKQIGDKAVYDSRREAEDSARRMASLEAGFGASGAIPTVGSPLLVEAKQASENELNNLMIGYNANIEAGAHKNQAAMDIAQGKLYKQKGKNLATASYMKAGTTLLTGLGSFGKAGGFGAGSGNTGLADDLGGSDYTFGGGSSNPYLPTD